MTKYCAIARILYLLREVYIVMNTICLNRIGYNQAVNFVPWEQYQKTLPKKQMGAGVLFLDKKGRILVLKPVYRDRWTVPGGVCEENESPWQTAYRETKEEIGLELEIKQLLAVNYNHAEGDTNENLQWWFYGGVLDEGQVRQINVDGDEIVEFKFVEIGEAERLGRKNVTKIMPAIKKAIKNKKAIYLENWEELTGG